MAILEKIRKRTTVLILIIGMALFAFVVSDVLTRGGFGSDKVGSAVGEINGEPISIDDFRARMEAAEGSFGPQATSTQIVNSIWDQTVRTTILSQEFEKLGIEIQQDQIMDLIRNNPNFTQNPQFQDANGNFDEDAFRNFIAELRVNQPQQYQLWLQSEAALIQAAKEQTYFDLVRAGVGATLNEGEMDYRLANDKVDIRYVRVPYTSVPDSTVSISKEEIAAYIKEHPKEFKQEAARDIRYVYFEEKASAADEAAIEASLKALLEDEMEYRQELDSTVVTPGFRNTNDMMAFLDRNSDTKYDTLYKAKAELPAQWADTLMALEVGEVFGPYRDGNNFKVSRMMDRKPNGSVKTSHILITYQGAERANPSITRTQEEAREKAEELLAEARKADAQFAQLARENSDGPSAPNGGDLGYFQEGVMTEAFNDFAFENPVGTIGLVETEFGFHVVKVDDKRDVVRLATLSRTIEPSDETVNTLFTEATSLEMAVTESPETFRTIAEEKGYTVRPVNKIGAMDENLPGLGAQRRIVQWAFNGDTEIGDIRRFDLANGYAIAQLTGTYRAGTMAVEDASVRVLPELRRKRKAEIITAANQGKSIDEIASSNGVAVSTATALNIKSPTIPGAGREPLVVGTAAVMDQGSTSDLIEGETGVFKLEVTSKTEAPALDNYAPYAKTLRSSLGPRVSGEVYQALREKAEIEDNRAIYY
ncbi:peptidylprolyl isomerase [Robiginitalea sp. SC105]|uniref:peptidylprolyl isomerase n=1 Tax=Robiginitalea sp. SC105 TaxID=2762332 RepID=UPI00163A17C8|nr:peptidylprolyl isomerase [Robiginitalea sp. SC105]MBC2837802.1 SurA N-terminal domain-containing protein [Robiginitalea sp. SC105]